MSIAAMSCAMALRDVKPSEKLLLLALSNYADDNMQCWPSQKRLSEDTCLSLRSIRNLLASLVAGGMISKAERQRQDGSRSTDIITLHFAGRVGATTAAPPATTAGGTRQPLPGGPATTAGLTTFEPSPNHQDEPLTPITPNGVIPPLEKNTAHGSRLPEGWTVPDPEWSKALESLGGYAAAMLELDRFRDYWTAVPGAKGRKADWPATWRNWVRRAGENAGPRHATGPPANFMDRLESDRAEAKRRLMADG